MTHRPEQPEQPQPPQQPHLGEVLATLDGRPILHDRGRGPEIVGTRITVYDVLDYHKHSEPAEAIAAVLPITVEQARVAIRYIQDHEADVQDAYRRILARHSKGNPPELQAYLDGAPERLRRRLEQLRRSKHAEAEGPARARDSA